ncbi:MAG TPA: carboxy terminal-processing peptidase, partial [Methylomirabilota bacterium]|nr:carboxy terminal-processing peptidase [Methylomirabilota bacterium]
MRFLIIAITLLAVSSGLRADVERDALITERHTNGFKWEPLVPGRDDASIAIAAARTLEHFHYAQLSFDDEVSSKFLDKYLDALDPGHLVFLQTDLREFEKWRTKLDDMTSKTGDTSPAEIIFNRFLQRFTQQVEYSTNLAATEKFEFKGNERYTPNRKELPRPKDLTEAKQLWRDRVRYEWLTEVLNAPEVQNTNAAASSSKITNTLASATAKPLSKTEEIRETLVRRYTRTLRMLQEFDSDDVVQIYLTSLTHIYDPHSDYMGKASFDNFNISMKLSLFGIGALLQSEDGYCKIKELMDGPAKKSGKVKPNDKIVAVAQGTNPPVDVVEMKLNKVVEMIRGPKDTEVRLTIIPVDAPDLSTRRVVTLIRDEIKLEDQEAKAKLIELPAEKGQPPLRLGIIDLPSFYADLENRSETRKSTTTDVAKLLKKLKEEKVAGIILDLRRNGGGSLEEAINLTGLFIKEGPVVQVKDPDGRITVDRDNDPSVLYDGPMVVLTSRFSASASEILAGALQDYGRALIVGDASTHGKGTVQTLLRLNQFLRRTNELGALKITIRKFYRASGSSTQRKGVVPDIVLPSINNHAEVGEASLPNALPWDTVPSAKYEPVNMIPPLLAELRKRSDARVSNDKDFTYLRDEIERFKKAREEKSYSMNEEERRREKEENETRAEARKKELRSRPHPGYKTYEFTLKNVNVPGLPPPMARTNVVMTSNNTGTNIVASKTINADGKVETVTNVIAKISDGEDDEIKDDSDVPTFDITLEEGRRLLQDLLMLT